MVKEDFKKPRGFQVPHSSVGVRVIAPVLSGSGCTTGTASGRTLVVVSVSRRGCAMSSNDEGNGTNVDGNSFAAADEGMRQRGK